MTRMHDLSNGELRELLRQHAVVMGPDEVLVVMVPPDWSPRDVRELGDGLRACSQDPELGNGMKILVIPGTALAVAQEPADPFPDL
jgi:hypothetical protein